MRYCAGIYYAGLIYDRLVATNLQPALEKRGYGSRAEKELATRAHHSSVCLRLMQGLSKLVTPDSSFVSSRVDYGWSGVE
jgi:hypothetical protein